MKQSAQEDHKGQGCMYSLRPTSNMLPYIPFFLSIRPAYHELAKCLISLLQPVLDFNSTHCIKDFFTFAKSLQQLNLDPEFTFLCSFNISSMFINMPLAETIQTCSYTLYNGEMALTTISRVLFTELLTVATLSVEFSFNNTMYK